MIRARAAGMAARVAALLAAAAIAASCGVEPQAVRTGGTGNIKATVVAGPITGLGSIVVNGIRFDETGARVTIDGVPDRPVSELGLGMIVEVSGEVDAEARVGRASTIVATPLLAGAAQAVDVGRAEITVLGQRVEVKAGTLLQGTSALASIRAGDRVVAYGFWDYFAGHIDATRLEVHSASSTASLVGPVGTVTGTRFTIGSLVVETAGAALSGLPGGIVPGGYVEVRGTTDPAGVLRAASVAARSELSPLEGARTEIEGYVSDFVSAARFRVLGVMVDASTARLSGLAGALGNGALVEVEGRFAQGLLVADLVEVKAGVQQPAAPQATTLAGLVTDFVAVSSFRVRDQTVDASAAAFTGGTSADLANGRGVEVTGVVSGNVLVAGAVVFTTPPTSEGTRLHVDGAIESYVSPASFRVNGQAVAAGAGTAFYGGTAADLADGRLVVVDGVVSGGVLAAASIEFKPRDSGSTVSLAGAITDFVSPVNFRVNNQAITTTAATVYEEGSATSLANGRLVEIEGRLADGVVTASRVHFSDPRRPGEDAEVEGRITDFVSVASFKVEGQLVDATAASFSNGGAGDLANGLQVHVKGPVAQGVLRARTVEIDR